MLNSQTLLLRRIECAIMNCKSGNYTNADDGIIGENYSASAVAYLRNDVRPISQNGPQCGLVALAMAHDFFPSKFQSEPVGVPYIFEKAKDLGFTLNGEIFSAQWLADLAKCVYPSADVSVMNMDEFTSPNEFLRALVCGKCVLVPYDTEKNFEPCLNNGHTAHWAIIVGFMVVDRTKKFADIYKCACFTVDEKIEDLNWFNLNTLCRICDENRGKNIGVWDIFENDISKEDIYVFALHGKSKHVNVWRYDILTASNANLNEIGPKYLEDGNVYILPAEGVRSALSGKIVVIE